MRRVSSPGRAAKDTADSILPSFSLFNTLKDESYLPAPAS